MNYIKDNMGRILGTERTEGGKTVVRDFKTGNIVSSYDANSDKTTDWKNNQFVKGDQSKRFLK